MIKRSVSLAGHRTSIALEQAFWNALEQLAADQKIPLARLIANVDARRGPDAPLASSLRLFVLDQLTRSTAEQP
ncbi:MAG: ribbon-helix-helix domain-containing protein [Pseudomonadota bacterium]